MGLVFGWRDCAAVFVWVSATIEGSLVGFSEAMGRGQIDKGYSVIREGKQAPIKDPDLSFAGCKATCKQ